jgi:predicted nuclease with TOPRIM domain
VAAFLNDAKNEREKLKSLIQEANKLRERAEQLIAESEAVSERISQRDQPKKKKPTR